MGYFEFMIVSGYYYFIMFIISLKWWMKGWDISVSSKYFLFDLLYFNYYELDIWIIEDV